MSENNKSLFESIISAQVVFDKITKVENKPDVVKMTPLKEAVNYSKEDDLLKVQLPSMYKAEIAQSFFVSDSFVNDLKNMSANGVYLSVTIGHLTDASKTPVTREFRPDDMLSYIASKRKAHDLIWGITTTPPTPKVYVKE